jgi:hypothetical protein
MGLAIRSYLEALAQETAVNLYAPIGTGDYRENGNRGMGALQVRQSGLQGNRSSLGSRLAAFPAFSWDSVNLPITLV